MYIRATASISPQKTWGIETFLTDPVNYEGNRLTCIEPDYKEFIDVKLLRRMSRIIRMGVAAASACLKEGNVELPEGIITGTAYGCLEDTGLFLNKLVNQNEELLTPTAFIQSTHNTVGAQIALMLNCKAYNNTFVHRGLSFESALLDAMMLLQEQETNNVLIGGIDETTEASHAILTRMGLFKRNPVSSLALFEKKSKGTIAGEGAAFFLLTNHHSENDYAQLIGIRSIYKPEDIYGVEKQILVFLDAHGISINDIDLVMMGNNGDVYGDTVYTQLSKSVFSNNATIQFKQLCGEYPTASSFALWLAANVIKFKSIPCVLGSIPLKEERISKVLIYNHYQNIHHSFILVSAC